MIEDLSLVIKAMREKSRLRDGLFEKRHIV